MRFGDERESSNFEDVTGRSGLGFGGGGGNALGCLLPLIASRFGIGGVIVLVIGYFLLSSLGGLGGGGGGSLAPSSQQSAPAGQSRLDQNTRHFMLQVLASTSTITGVAGGPETFSAVSLSPAVPEPQTYAMMLAGLALLGWVGRRRQQKTA